MDKTKNNAQQDCAQTPKGGTHNNPLETIHTGETVCNTVSTKERKQNTKTEHNKKTEQDTKKTRTRKNTNTMTEMVNWIEENMLAKDRIRYNCLRDRIEILITNDEPYSIKNYELRIKNDMTATRINDPLMGINGEPFNGQLTGISGEPFNGQLTGINGEPFNGQLMGN